MMWLLNLIPGIGKIADAFGAYYSKKLDVDLEKYKVNGRIDEVRLQAALGAFVAAQGNPTGRVMYALFQGLFVIPLGLWFGLACINSGFRDIMGWHWNVHTFPILEQWGWVILGYLFFAALGRRS